MVFGFAPYDDLVVSRMPDEVGVRRQLCFRWGARVLGTHGPAALRLLGYEPEALELLALASESFDVARARDLVDACRQLHHRVWQASTRDHHELATFTLGCVSDTAQAIGHEVGAVHSVLTTWIGGVGPGAVLEQSEAELVEVAKLRLMGVAVSARTLAHIVGGEQGYVVEVAQQHAELSAHGAASEHQNTWGSLVAGRRYRVYTAFTDLDGGHHPWGESWRFDGCTFSPTTCELQLNVSEGVQLDPKGRPGPAIAVTPFRLAIAVGERPGYPRHAVRSLIVED